MRIKICGMKYSENMTEVAKLQPAYMGFIFYEKSKRNFTGSIPELPASIKKTGVFVNASIDVVVRKVMQYGLQAIQLHGDETVAYIAALRSSLHQVVSTDQKSQRQGQVELIKVFGVNKGFDFDVVTVYEPVVDYFLFDTKGKERGGNGVSFDWSILSAYASSIPFFLSGGIALEQIESIHKLRKTRLPLYALDINSKFETKPGFKSVVNIQRFKDELSTN